MNTPQSTKKIDIQAIEDVFTRTGCEFDPKGHWIKVTDPHRTYKQLLTILKETLEEALPDKKMITKYEGKRQSLQQGWNNAIDQTKANLNNLLGGDDE